MDLLVLLTLCWVPQSRCSASLPPAFAAWTHSFALLWPGRDLMVPGFGVRSTRVLNHWRRVGAGRIRSWSTDGLLQLPGREWDCAFGTWHEERTCARWRRSVWRMDLDELWASARRREGGILGSLGAIWWCVVAGVYVYIFRPVCWLLGFCLFAGSSASTGPGLASLIVCVCGSPHLQQRRNPGRLLGGLLYSKEAD